MAVILKLYRRSFSKSFNIYALRYFSSFNQASQASSVCSYKNQFNSLCNQKPAIFMSKNVLLYRKVALYQKRCFQTFTILCEDVEVLTPPFPESIAEGDIKWEKKVGDSVQVDEVVCEIETDKTSIPVPSPTAGVIAETFFNDSDTVKAGSKLFRLTTGAAGGAVPAPKSAPPPTAAPTAPAPRAPAPTAPAPKAPAPAAPAPAKPPPKPVPKPPAAKVPPSAPPKGAPPGTPLGALVRLPSASPTIEIAGTRTEHHVKMNRMRLKIASRLKEAQNTNVMLTTFNEIDMTSIIAFRKENQETFTKKYGIKLGFMSAFIKAVSFALEDQPVVNAVIVENEILYRDYIDVSVAVATPKGLLVPVIRNVNYMNFGEIEKALSDLGKKAKDGKISIEDMEGGTFTISNGGVFGSLLSTPIINPPQSAILGMHATFERPVAIKGKVVIRPMMYIALTYDHRLIDGREGVMFLRKIKAAVEDPRIIVAGL